RSRAAHDARPSYASLRNGVVAATGVTILTLFGLLFASVITGRALASLPQQDAIAIEITGFQWWWEAVYLDRNPSQRVTTANEVHVPTGRTVLLLLDSADVIHSLWIPNLHGKMDLVPGRQNTLWLRIDEPGIYRGQCAEYCGVQHAHMALTVIAESTAQFDAWLNGQRQTPPPPSSAEAQHGQALFRSTTCVMCHSVRGTIAGARLGPDLTHVATRGHLAAATLPNSRDNLLRWIADPQHVKPGNHMPSSDLSRRDLEAIASYLETLR
ncbi:MAG TPA: c-type cytochrome, partial [Vicinamibacterales bacterium]|nr:c-type cytochrome [Vicinamibacterales bacterium]